MAKRKPPYKLKIVLEHSDSIFRPSLVGDKNPFSIIMYAASTLVFEKLVAKGYMRHFIVIFSVVGSFMLVISSLLLAAGLKGSYDALMNWTYMVFMVLLLPFIFYFGDTYYAMQLKHALYLGNRMSAKGKAGEEPRPRTIQWNSTTLSVLHAVQYSNAEQFSINDFALSAGVVRGTMQRLLNGMKRVGMLTNISGKWSYPGIVFEAYRPEGHGFATQKLSKADQQRLQYLFRVLCFVGF